MNLGRTATNKVKNWIRGITLFFVLAFIISFWHEIGGVFSLISTLFLGVLGFPITLGNEDVFLSFSIISFNCLFGFGLIFMLWVMLVAWQSLLPVNGLREIYQTAWHLWLYITRNHGPAIFVRDGNLIATSEELERLGHGVISVDFNSAIVLEELDQPPGFGRVFYRLENNLLCALGLTDRVEPVRVCGPGIVFTHRRERIRGAVDLRKHFRLQPKVTSYTREGIELSANVLAIFTIGQDPDVLPVTYVGDRRPENLRAITLKSVQGGQGYWRLTDITDELDEADREEIHHYARVIEHTNEIYEFTPLPPTASMPVFDRDRVFSAVFAQARASEKEVVHWTDLPTRVGASIYREILPTINYDDLYDIKGNGKFPLPSFKAKMRLQMRNNGILAYRLTHLRSGAPFVLSRVYHESELEASEVRQLTNSKILRDRGIKMIFSGFGDPAPVSPVIYKQRLDAWRATWDRDLDLTLASRELEALRVSSRARAEAQQDLWYSLSQLFNEENHFTDEALAIRVLQALEQSAIDPKTRQLLPLNTLDILNQVRGVLIPSDFVRISPSLSATQRPPDSPNLPEDGWDEK